MERSYWCIRIAYPTKVWFLKVACSHLNWYGGQYPVYPIKLLPIWIRVFVGLGAFASNPHHLQFLTIACARAFWKRIVGPETRCIHVWAAFEKTLPASIRLCYFRWVIMFTEVPTALLTLWDTVRGSWTQRHPVWQLNNYHFEGQIMWNSEKYIRPCLWQGTNNNRLLAILADGLLCKVGYAKLRAGLFGCIQAVLLAP